MVSMRHLPFLFTCNFIVKKWNTNNLRYGLVARFALLVKCLECTRNAQIYSLRAGPFKETSFFGLYEMTCIFKVRINLQSNRPCNFKGVAWF